MAHYRAQILACDFFTIETLYLQTLYVLLFIEVGSRRVHYACYTAHLNETLVTQQGTQLLWELEAQERPIRFLIHDNDGKFTQAIDTVFVSEQVKVIHTPYRAPNANAYAERWVRTVREECQDKILIFNQGHLRRVMREYVEYSNTARPHQGIEQQIPITPTDSPARGPIRCRNVLGGIIHDYYREAA
jgi:putative transposase